LGQPPTYLHAASQIIAQQMGRLKYSGLNDARSELIVGVNGGSESKPFVDGLIPLDAKTTYHGLQCRNECRTLRLLEEWLPGHDDYYVLYFHSKGATKPPGDDFTGRWRECMMKHLIDNWRQCVSDLDAGHEAVGCHWMVPPATPPGQHIFAGTFWWAKASYLRTLPSIMKRDRIKVSGIDSLESRFEAEVWLCNGPRLPKVKDYCGPFWNPSKPHVS
jgi:hypothetical protein